MAIIRQQTQVFNQPIGVVRADASDSAVGEAISRSASEIANLAFRDATIEAQRVGEETGGASSRSDIVTIDPATGRPVAYQPPSNFGRIAARSYQNMIDRRFEESINTEITERGMEIANTSTSANQYRDRMSAYIQEMYSNAVGKDGELNNYGRFIQETGTGYVASTFATMREREVKAAREALIRQQNLQNFMSMREIPNLITANAPEEEIFNRIEVEEQRLLDLYSSGAISLSTYSSRLNDLDGYTSQVADNRLINIYSNLPEDGTQRPALLAAMRNPSLIPQLAEQLGMPNLSDIIIAAKINGSVDSLISSMTSQATYMGEMTENAIDEYVRGIDVNPNGTVTDILTSTLSIPEEFRDEVRSELVGQWVAQNLNLATMDQTDVDRLVNELRTVGEYNFNDVADIAGNLVASEISSMSQEQRNSLAEQLSTRRASLNAISSEKTSQRINDLRGDIRTSWQGGAVVEDAPRLRANLNLADIDETTRATLLGVLDSAVVEQNLNSARSIDGISLNRMKDIRDVVRGDSTIQEAFLATLNENERVVFESYRDAYNRNPSQADGEMGRRVTSLENITQDAALSMRLDGINGAIESGFGVSTEDLEFLDQQLFADLGPISAADAIQNETLLSYAGRGYMLPTLVRSIENGLRSRNEGDAEAAVTMFEMFTQVTGQVEGGRTQPIDLLRSELSQENYALFSAVSILARQETRPPLDIMLEFQSAEENPDALIRADLGLSSSAPLRSLITKSGVVMSSNYEQEILAMMRLRRVRGEVFTEDTVDRIIEDYTESKYGLTSDDAVMGPYIGDQTVYARTNYFSAKEISDNLEMLFDTMAQDPNLRETLIGGTTSDAIFEGFRNSLGLNISAGIGAALEAISPQTFGSDATEALAMRRRIMDGLQVAGLEIKYNPIVSSFNQGRAVYQLGYEQNGAFQPILINGEPWVLAESEDEPSSFATASAYNNYLAATRGGATSEQIHEARFQYFRTLPHMTDDMLRQEFPDLMEELENAD